MEWRRPQEHEKGEKINRMEEFFSSSQGNIEAWYKMGSSQLQPKLRNTSVWLGKCFGEWPPLYNLRPIKKWKNTLIDFLLSWLFLLLLPMSMFLPRVSESVLFPIPLHLTTLLPMIPLSLTINSALIDESIDWSKQSFYSHKSCIWG